MESSKIRVGSHFACDGCDDDDAVPSVDCGCKHSSRMAYGFAFFSEDYNVPLKQ